MGSTPLDLGRSNLAKSGQISRNALCPCGSGKRYKRSDFSIFITLSQYLNCLTASCTIFNLFAKTVALGSRLRLVNMIILNNYEIVQNNTTVVICRKYADVPGLLHGI